MGCVISCGLKLILQIFNTILCLAFLAIAVFGILLKTSKTVVESILKKIFDQFNIGDAEMRHLTQFILDNAGGIAIVLIVVGFALAILCFIGCVASCCGCGLLLKIYAVILIILTVAQIIFVAVMFSNRTRLSSLLIGALDKLLPSYDQTNREGEAATAVWNVLMTFNEICCGMNNYTDFKNQNGLPQQCCNYTLPSGQKCTSVEAQTVNVPGCRDKVTEFFAENLKLLLYIAIGAILLQAVLIAIVIIIICL
ncbi:hypothetical protein Aperf_G00000108234 [Anoplocephala perfoliata]